MIKSNLYNEQFQTIEERLQRFIDLQGLSNIMYFGFYRFYDTGQALLLSTNSALARNRIDQGIALHSEPPIEYLRANQIVDWTLVNQNSPEIIKQEYKLFGYGHSMMLFHFHKGFYDVFYFSMGGIDDDACKSLIHLMPALLHISQDFLITQLELINNSELVPIPMLEHAKFRRKYYGNKVLLHVRGRKNMIHVSPQELQVMRLYVRGYQAKEGAKMMDISSRTYKGYLHNLGQKFGGVGKELITIARENYLV